MGSFKHKSSNDSSTIRRSRFIESDEGSDTDDADLSDPGGRMESVAADDSANIGHSDDPVSSENHENDEINRTVVADVQVLQRHSQEDRVR